MTNTIFDLLQEVPEGQEGYFDIAGRLPEPKDDSFLDKASDFGKTILKGTIEGVSRLGRILGPLEEFKPEKEIEEKQTESLEKLLPTQEGFAQKSIRRGLREAPTMLAFPGSKLATLPRSIAAGFLGEGSKELGAPEWVQAAAEITAYIGPDLTKKLLETGKNSEIIKTAKKFGLTDEQIAPLIQSDFKQKWLSKLAPKRGKTQKALESTKQALGEAYETIKQSPQASVNLNPEQQKNLLQKLGEIGLDIPSSVRNEVAQDFADLVKKPITGESLLNLYRDINKALGPKTKELSRFKEPIKEALQSISPQLAEDFSKINELYTRYSKIAPKLKPSLVSDLISAAESLGLFGSILYGDVSIISKFLFEKGSRIAASNLLFNPRLQQLSEKTLQALNQNKYGLASKIMKQMKDQIGEIDENIEDQFPVLSEEELKELFKNR